MATREIKTIFALDGEQKYTDAIKNINKEQRVLNAELKASAAKFNEAGDAQGKLRSQIDLLNQKIELQEQKVKEARAAMEQATQKYGENSDAAQELKIQYHNAEAELSKLKATVVQSNIDLQTQQSKLKAVGDQAQIVGDKMEKMGSKLSTVGTNLTRNVTLPIVAAAGFAAKAAMDYESAFAGVVKTVDGTESQLSELKESIVELSTEIPVAATGIAAVAESAGQLGIQTENVLGFTEVMINLGEATNMSATEGAEQLAKFANITQMSQDDFDRLGSAIVALGNNTATTEADIVSMGMRLAGAGKQIGMTEADIMGLAAAMSSVGIEAEAGGSAFSKVMINMQLAVLNGGKELEDFAAVSGMSTEKFQQAFKENAMDALTAFVVGLGSLEKEGGSAIATLEEMGISEVRMRDALLRAAGAGDLMTKAVRLSNDAWEENNALTEEAAKRYETTESQMEISKNKITAAAITIGEQLLPVIADLAEDVASAAKAFASMDPEMQKTVIVALGVAAALGPVTKVVGTVTKTVGSATSAIGKYVSKLAEKKAAEAATTAATKGMSMATGGFTAVLNPVTLILVGAAAAAGALYLAYRDATKGQRALTEAAQGMATEMGNWSDDVAAATSVLNGFNMAVIVSAEQMSEWDNGISEAQQKIIGLAQKAAEESRAYTEEETEEINKLIGLINDYTQKKIDAYLTQQQVVTAMAAQETEVTLQKANEIVAGAEDAKAQTLAIAAAKYSELIGLAETSYGHLGEKDKEAYDAQVKTAKESYQEQIDQANDLYAETMSLVTGKYTATLKADNDYLARLYELNGEIVKAEADKNEAIEKSNEIAAYSSIETAKQRGVATLEANQKWKQQTDEIYSEMAQIYADLGDEQLGSFIAMVSNTETYGGKLDEETQMLVDNIITSFDNMPDDAKEKMRETMQGLMDGMEEKDQDLFRKASGIASGVIGRLKTVFDINSPSRVAREITRNVGEGLELGLEDKRQGVSAKAGQMADDVLSEAARMSEAQSLIAGMAQSRGIGLQIDAAGYANSRLLKNGSVPSTQNINVTGEIIHKGVNDKGEFIASVTSAMDSIREELRMDLMLAGG